MGQSHHTAVHVTVTHHSYQWRSHFPQLSTGQSHTPHSCQRDSHTTQPSLVQSHTTAVNGAVPPHSCQRDSYTTQLSTTEHHTTQPSRPLRQQTAVRAERQMTQLKKFQPHHTDCQQRHNTTQLSKTARHNHTAWHSGQEIVIYL